MLFLGSRSTHALEFDSTFTSQSGEKEHYYSFKIKATTFGHKTAVKQVDIVVGCFEETSFEVNILGSLPINITNVEDSL